MSCRSGNPDSWFPLDSSGAKKLKSTCVKGVTNHVLPSVSVITSLIFCSDRHALKSDRSKSFRKNNNNKRRRSYEELSAVIFLGEICKFQFHLICINPLIGYLFVFLFPVDLIHVLLLLNVKAHGSSSLTDLIF